MIFKTFNYLLKNRFHKEKPYLKNKNKKITISQGSNPSQCPSQSEPAEQQ